MYIEIYMHMYALYVLIFCNYCAFIAFQVLWSLSVKLLYYNII